MYGQSSFNLSYHIYVIESIKKFGKMKAKWIATFGVLAAVLACYFQCGEKFNPESLKGKKVLVTGSSTGIGEQLAYHYARLGARIIITARSEDLLQKVAEKCMKLGAEHVEIVKADMQIEKHVDRLFRAVFKMGGLDILVLNHVSVTPAVWHGQDNMTSFNDLLRINFLSYVELASKLLPFLAENKGHIGVISSVAGKVPSGTLTNYCSSKFALQGFFGALRQDLKIRGIDVSVTIGVLGPIGTDTAKRQFDKISSHVMDFTSSPSDAALEIIKAISTKKVEFYYPKFVRVIIGLHKLFPSFVEDVSTPLIFRSLAEKS